MDARLDEARAEITALADRIESAGDSHLAAVTLEVFQRCTPDYQHVAAAGKNPATHHSFVASLAWECLVAEQPERTEQRRFELWTMVLAGLSHDCKAYPHKGDARSVPLTMATIEGMAPAEKADAARRADQQRQIHAERAAAATDELLAGLRVRAEVVAETARINLVHDNTSRAQYILKFGLADVMDPAALIFGPRDRAIYFHAFDRAWMGPGVFADGEREGKQGDELIAFCQQRLPRNVARMGDEYHELYQRLARVEEYPFVHSTIFPSEVVYRKFHELVAQTEERLGMAPGSATGFMNRA